MFLSRFLKSLLVSSSLVSASLSGCQRIRTVLRQPVRDYTTRYLQAADVVGGTELDTGRYEVAQYTYRSDIPNITDTWFRQEIFLKAHRLAALPVGQPVVVPNALFTIQGYGQATWYFQQYQDITGTVIRLPAPKGIFRLRFALRYADAKQGARPLLQRTLTFRLDSVYFQRTHQEYHGQYDDLRLALKEPAKVSALDLTSWAIDYEKWNGQDSGPDPLYQRLCELYNLEELILKFSNLQGLPVGFEKLKRLKKLDISYNSLATFPAVLYQLDSLRELNLAWNHLDSIPPAVAQLKSLRTLDLSDNRLTRYPEAVSQLTELDSLWLGNANLRELPTSIGHLQHLQLLGLDGFWNSKRRNHLINLDALLALPQLRKISLQSNALEKLPAAIYRLPALEELNLHYNGLNSAMVEVGRLPRLKKLEL